MKSWSSRQLALRVWPPVPAPLLLRYNAPDVSPHSSRPSRCPRYPLSTRKHPGPFDLALSHGCDGFEFDVRQTADRRAVICHDSKIHDLEISHADPGDLPDLPSLQQVLACYQELAFLDIELKVLGLERTVVAALRALPPRRGWSFRLSCRKPSSRCVTSIPIPTWA